MKLKLELEKLKSRIVEYQKEYIQIIEEFFLRKTKKIDDYYTLIDKIEILLKKIKQSLLNYLNYNKSIILYGGGTYFLKNEGEYLPILAVNSTLLIEDSITKLSIFFRSHEENIDLKLISQIIERSIKNTLNLKDNIIKGEVILFNSADFTSGIANETFEESKNLILHYFNRNFDTRFRNLEDFINENKLLSYEQIELKYPLITKMVFTAACEDQDSLKVRVESQLGFSGMKEITLMGDCDVERVCSSLFCLFSQALMLENLSLIFGCDLYITKPNVMYFLRIMHEEKDPFIKKIIYNFLFFQSIRKYSFICNENEISIWFKQNRTAKLIGEIAEKGLNSDTPITEISKEIDSFLKKHLKNSEILNNEKKDS